MEQGTTDPTPDLDDLYQEETEAVSVPVRGEGAFLVQQLPARKAQYGTDTVPGTVWTDLLPATPKRARATLVSDAAFYVNTTGTGGGMLWPANVPYELRHTERVYVRAAGADPAVATIGHASELWAD